MKPAAHVLYSFFLDGIPLDGASINRTVTYSMPLVGVFFGLAIGGEAFSIVCLIFSAIFRKKR